MKLKIKKLRVETIIGVHAWEKNTPRPLEIDLEIEFDGMKAAKTDVINHTPDYDELCKIITQETSKARYNLIEKLAVQLLYKVMEDERIQYAKIEISKPGAVENAETVCVIEEISR